MKIKFKKTHKDARTPNYAHATDGCADLTAVSMSQLSHNKMKYDTGIAVEIPEGYVGLVFPRSSIHRTELYLSNSVGVIDAGYRGSIQVVFNRRPYGESYSIGDRVAQLMIIPRPTIEYVECEELPQTPRGTGGFGSSGK